MPNTDLTAITPDECKDVPEKGKTKALLEAYGVAAEDHDLKHWKEMLRKHQEAVNEDLELQKERQAKKASKAERQRRKSEAVDEDEMEVDGEEEEKPKSKKRKKGTEGEEDEKVRYPFFITYSIAKSTNISRQRPQRQRRSSSSTHRRLLRPSLLPKRRPKPSPNLPQRKRQLPLQPSATMRWTTRLLWRRSLSAQLRSWKGRKKKVSIERKGFRHSVS